MTLVELSQSSFGHDLGWYLGWLAFAICVWVMCSDSDRVTTIARTHERTMKTAALFVVGPLTVIAMDYTISSCTEEVLRQVCGDLWEWCRLVYCWQLPG